MSKKYIIIKDKVYNIVVLLLALLSILLTIFDFTNNILNIPLYRYLDVIILTFFWGDYIYRFVKSNKKIAFIKGNIFDLIAIIPFYSLFSLFRIFRIFRILRITKVTRIFKAFRIIGFSLKFKKFLYTNGFIYMIYLNLFIILAGSLGIYIFEKGITVQSFSDAIWWSFVTATTVGYGDISPSTSAGRIIASILMLVGISCVSMLTGTIATYFQKNSTNTVDCSELTEEQIKLVNNYIENIKNNS